MLLFVSPFHWFFTSDRFDVCTIVRWSNPRWHYYFWSFLLLFLQFSIQILKRPTYKTNVNKQSAELSNVFSGVARKVEFCSLQQTSAYSVGRAILKVISILKDIFSCNVELIEFGFLILWNIIVNLTGVSCSFEFPACLTCLEALVWLVVCFTCQEQVKETVLLKQKNNGSGSSDCFSRQDSHW